MNKRQFLKSAGVLGAASLIPFGKSASASRTGVTRAMRLPSGTCVLIPTETAGPFPLDLTENDFYFRQDVRESELGVQQNLRMKIIGADNCLPMQNVRVNIWQCNRLGDYSGYNAQAGLTYLRGYQFTDVNGEVEFITVFPGWYPGRICHIHFQVYVSSQYSAISQLTFPIEPKQIIYNDNPTLYTDGEDPVSFSQDGVFADGYEYQITTLTPKSETGGYDSFLEVAIEGSGTVGIGQLEKHNARQFVLGQNVPNPYTDETTIPFTLHNASEVTIELWNLTGNKVYTVTNQPYPAGDHRVLVNLKSLSLPAGNYMYRFNVRNSNGTFSDCKMMSAVK